MITCVIQYTLDPHAVEDFEKYATTWPPIIERCGGRLTGYYLPKEGANDFAIALIDFDSLAAAITARLFEVGWIERGITGPHRRSVRITAAGGVGLADTFGFRAG